MIIDCVSDLHGHYPELEGGDLLIIAGDLTARDTHEDYDAYFNWLSQCSDKYKKIIIIAGNHDNLVQQEMVIPASAWNQTSTYLCDSGTEFVYEEDEVTKWGTKSFKKSLKIWGSPWTLRFKGMNPKCMAFTVDTEEELAEKWKLIPDDVDILVTHSPPFTCFDSCIDSMDGKVHNVGSPSLNKALDRIKPFLHVFGHIHEHGGKKSIYKPDTIIVNASHVNELYQPVNKPIRIEL